ncbi:DUF1883 domain-containing protein [Amycolatopsis sp. A133]|uniref:DUF1883 domain-containing protein n=1 Tax=Amycolatopsis sp. A133 TaxID=3064472 RepID=UPI0027F8E89C|nr:DUF1883 domain-containing protein [Amycolatopsis sp. A133]MDQ7810994.1 DUF1883 domain-containing protein [Amycolatopsis sp. A133]
MVLWEPVVLDLGWLHRAVIVRVRLDAVVNVRLLSAENVDSYRRRSAYRMIGGVATAQRLDIRVPFDGHWYVAVDNEGLAAGKFQVDVTVVS